MADLTPKNLTMTGAASSEGTDTVGNKVSGVPRLSTFEMGTNFARCPKVKVDGDEGNLSPTTTEPVGRKKKKDKAGKTGKKSGKESRTEPETPTKVDGKRPAKESPVKNRKGKRHSSGAHKTDEEAAFAAEMDVDVEGGAAEPPGDDAELDEEEFEIDLDLESVQASGDEAAPDDTVAPETEAPFQGLDEEGDVSMGASEPAAGPKVKNPDAQQVKYEKILGETIAKGMSRKDAEELLESIRPKTHEEKTAAKLNRRAKKREQKQLKKGKGKVAAALEGLRLTSGTDSTPQSSGANSRKSSKSKVGKTPEQSGMGPKTAAESGKTKKSASTKDKDKGEPVKEKAVATLPYREVTGLEGTMSSGCCLILYKQKPADPSPDDVRQVVQAWQAAHPDAPIANASSFGKSYVLELRNLDDAIQLDGTALSLSEPAVGLICRRKVDNLARRFLVKNTTRVPRQSIMTGLAKCYPKDNFSLYQGTSGGVAIDMWLFEFERPPRTTAQKVHWPGTEKGDGEKWSSPVEAAGDPCFFCKGAEHRSPKHCVALRFVQKSSHVNSKS